MLMRIFYYIIVKIAIQRKDSRNGDAIPKRNVSLHLYKCKILIFLWLKKRGGYQLIFLTAPVIFSFNNPLNEQ